MGLSRVCFLFAALVLTGGVTAVMSPALGDGQNTPAYSFPRLMSMSIGGPKYYEERQRWELWSKHQVVILGFYPGWEKHGKAPRRMRDVVRGVKAGNPGVLVGQYTIVQESQDDPAHPNRNKAAKISRENWWLMDASGRRVQWTDRYKAWDINISEWARPDRNGERYSEWLARSDHETFFRDIPEFDIWYFDNALSRPAVRAADWRGIGRNESRTDPLIARAYRQGHVRHWHAAAALKPEILLIGNSDDLSSPEYRGQLHGAFLEAIMGLSWSTESREGWDAAMARYRAALRDTKAPNIVGFSVHGEEDDYALLRFGLTSALLDNGYFSYSRSGGSYRDILWFDEFDAELGMPIDEPPVAPWRDGVYRRLFTGGLVLVNPSRQPAIVDVEPGYRRIYGRQDPLVNNGEPAGKVRIAGRDGVILVRVAD